jgi:diguanylate cyclase (GGDEF)-like protein/PAS domain S-box-containing protein
MGQVADGVVGWSQTPSAEGEVRSAGPAAAVGSDADGGSMGTVGVGMERDELAELVLHANEADRFPFIVADADLLIVWANEALQDFGWTSDDLVGRQVFEFVHQDDLPRAGIAISTAEGGGYVIPAGVRILRKDGEYTYLEASATPFEDQHGHQHYAFGLRPDPFTRAKDRALTAMVAGADPGESLGILCQAFSSHRPGGVTAFDGDDGRREVVGVLPPELAGVIDGLADRTPGTPWMEAERTGDLVVVTDLDSLPPETAAAARDRGLSCGLYVTARDPGRPHPALLSTWMPDDSEAEMTGMNLVDQAGLAFIALQSRAAREHLDHLAHHDVLTGLANRARFFAAVEEVTGPNGRPGPVALAYLDLDDFKAANDDHGHLAGDQILEIVARRFRAEVRSVDLVARLGGDEFAVLFGEGLDETHAVAVAHRVRASAAEPIEVADTKVRLGASAGLAFAADARRVGADKADLAIAHPAPRQR